jgi:hypothetical protein
MKTVDAQICLQCGALEWVIVSSRYQASYMVRPDGHLEFEEEMKDLEYYCNSCGSSSLLGIEGSPKIFQDLIKLKPAKRIISTLELIVEGKIEMKDDFSPEDVLDFIETGFALTLKDKEASKSFLSEIKRTIARWKIIEG